MIEAGYENRTHKRVVRVQPGARKEVVLKLDSD
jgi:hypothetical protein